MLRLFRAVHRSLGEIRSRRTDLVLGLGGYASVPTGIAALVSRRPLVLLEQNVVPGKANRLLARLGGKAPDKGYVLLQTGYGPSGLPHIGTFGEVVRTTMVRQAFARLSDVPTRLFCFSDDMDGLRKVPDNIPNQEVVAAHLGKPLTAIPDPFGTHESFGHHNNARL